MGDLIFTAMVSLDGFVADEHGNFDWAAPGEDVHAFVNDLERPIGSYLYGRRLYQTMVFWEALDLDGQPEVVRDYAELWRSADKVVYSSTLATVLSTRTRIEPRFDVGAVAELKESSERDLSVGGPTLAAPAFRAGLVDEIRLFLVPVIVGSGTEALPDDVRIGLELVDEHRFDGGVVFLRYRVAGRTASGS